MRRLSRLARENRADAFERAAADHAGLGGRAYFIDFSAKLAGVPDSGIAQWAVESGASPTLLAQVALASFDAAFRDAAHERARGRAREACEALMARADAVDGVPVWRLDATVRKYGLTPGWCSALTQSLVASALLRYGHEAGDESAVRLAADAACAYVPGGRDIGLAVTIDGGFAPEEAPSTPSSLILNGWMYGLFGLWEVAEETGDAALRDAFTVSSTTLADVLPRYRHGRWSRYSLYPHPMPDLAKPFYHALHVEQLRVLSCLTGESRFAKQAETWGRSLEDPAARALAMSQKALFAIRVGTLWRA